MLRNGDWGNFSLRCDEAKALHDHAAIVKTETQIDVTVFSSASVLERSKAEQREASVGLAKFKLSQGDIVRAKEIAELCSIPYIEIGLMADGIN